MALAILVAACAARRVEDRAPEAAPSRPHLPTLPLPTCDDSFAEAPLSPPSGTGLPPTPRKLAPRSDTPVALDGRIAYVDRESGQVRAVDVGGGHPVVVLPAPSPGRTNTQLFPGPDPRELLLFRDGAFFQLSAGGLDAGVVPTESPGEARERRAARFAPIMTAHGTSRGASVTPLAGPHALAFVPDDGSLAPGLYLANASDASLLRVFSSQVSHTWTPLQREGPGAPVVLAASDGRYYLLEPAPPALRCEGPRMPKGFLPGPSDLSGNGRLFGFAALRPLLEGGGWAVSLGLFDRERRAVQWLGALPHVTALEIRAVPGREAFVVAPRNGTSATLYSLDRSGLRQLSAPIEGFGQLAVLSTAVAWTQETPTTELIPTPKPPERYRDPRSGCDPVPPQGGCGWVTNGCDLVFAGPCVRYVREPDPADGLYAIDLP